MITAKVGGEKLLLSPSFRCLFNQPHFPMQCFPLNWCSFASRGGKPLYNGFEAASVGEWKSDTSYTSSLTAASSQGDRNIVFALEVLAGWALRQKVDIPQQGGFPPADQGGSNSQL